MILNLAIDNKRFDGLIFSFDGLYYFYWMVELERKKDGFQGERCVVLPPFVVQDSNLSPISKQYYVSDIGYYPKAEMHYRKRDEGCKNHILIHCIDGKGKVAFGGSEYILQTDNFIVIPAHCAHIYEADKDTPWTIYWLHFGGVSADLLLHTILDVVYSKRNKLSFDAEQVNLFQKMYIHLSNGYGKEIMDSVSLILPAFLRGYLYPEVANWEDSSSQTDVIQEAIGFLKSQIRSRVTLRQVADHIHFSVSHCSKLFKQRTGYSPIEYLNHLKIQEACYLLRFSQLRIAEISFELAYEDPYYFSRLFKEHMGISPLEYRKSNSG